MALVLVAGTQPAHVHLTGAAEELLQVLVLGADLLAQVTGGRDQLVVLQLLLCIMRLQVSLAERCHAHQTRLHGRSGLRAAVTGHRRTWQLFRCRFAPCARTLRRSGRCAPGALDGLSPSGAEGPSAELPHGFGQHGVPAESGTRVKGLPAFWAAVGAVFPPFIVPVICDAGRAVTVATRDGHGVRGQIQTDGAVKLLLRP